jgi:hypothetical protein
VNWCEIAIGALVIGSIPMAFLISYWVCSYTGFD